MRESTKQSSASKKAEAKSKFVESNSEGFEHVRLNKARTTHCSPSVLAAAAWARRWAPTQLSSHAPQLRCAIIMLLSRHATRVKF